MEDIKLIACDMDDTLLTSELEVSPATIAAIAKARALGKVFIIATGRMYVSAKMHTDKLGLDVPIVTYNGALVKGSKSGEVFFEKKMALTTAQAVLDYCKVQGYYLQYYVGEKYLIERDNEFSAYYGRIAGIMPTPVGEALYTAQEAPYKILLMLPEEQFQQVWQDFEVKFAGLLDVTSSKKGFLELMTPGVNKWEAVKAVAESLGIKPEETMCIGDSNNDLSMIENAGLGVAMGNAPFNVKMKAKMVTADQNHDGVALAINTVLTKQAQEQLC